MTDPIAVAISILALGVSSMTAWLTLLRRGTVRMTQPTVIYFGPDHPNRTGLASCPKVYLRALLFATSKRGRVIESMHVALHRNETHQNFNIWVHGDEKLVRGSGLFVADVGVAASHHFLPPSDLRGFHFSEGQYKFEVFARLLGDKERTLLFSQMLEITSEIAAGLRQPGTGVYFDWGPDSGRYSPHVETRPPTPEQADNLRLFELLTNAERASN